MNLRNPDDTRLLVGPAGGNQGAGGVGKPPASLNVSGSPPVSGALGVIGLSSRVHRLNRKVKD